VAGEVIQRIYRRRLLSRAAMANRSAEVKDPANSVILGPFADRDANRLSDRDFDPLLGGTVVPHFTASYGHYGMD